MKIIYTSRDTRVFRFFGILTQKLDLPRFFWDIFSGKT
mgnify:CR=1 FL=1